MVKLDDLPKIKLIMYMDVMFVSLTSVLVLGIIGYFVDLQFGTKPLGTLSSILISFPITIIVITKRIKKIL